MALKSAFLSKDPRHLACQTKHSAHITKGQSGSHVADIQAALNLLDDLHIDPEEKAAEFYGPSTAAAVLAFKRKRRIINKSYQSAEDDIVGVMTITALDNELAAHESQAALLTQKRCHRADGPTIALARPQPVPEGLTLRIAAEIERTGSGTG